MLIKKSDDLISGSYHLQKSTIESDEVLFNPGWFGPAENTIYSVISSNDLNISANPSTIAM